MKLTWQVMLTSSKDSVLLMEEPRKSLIYSLLMTLLFYDANEMQLLNIKEIVLCFEAVSGLRINFFKSEMIGVG